MSVYLKRELCSIVPGALADYDYSSRRSKRSVRSPLSHLFLARGKTEQAGIPTLPSLVFFFQTKNESLTPIPDSVPSGVTRVKANLLISLLQRQIFAPGAPEETMPDTLLSLGTQRVKRPVMLSTSCQVVSHDSSEVEDSYGMLLRGHPTVSCTTIETNGVRFDQPKGQRLHRIWCRRSHSFLVQRARHS